jgi:hypothetical protein
MIRAQPHYRRDAFVNGLTAAGWKVESVYPTAKPGPGDVLVIWNRYGEGEAVADKWEKLGGLVFVAENGYVGLDAAGVQYYALSISQHNGAGPIPTGDGSRWEKLGIEVKPWRTDGHALVIRGQRGIGSRLMASPPDWHKRVGAHLAKLAARKVVVLDHPGKPACDPEVVAWLCKNFEQAHACLVWSSGAAIRALIEGVPAFYAAPHWICEGAALKWGGYPETPRRDDAARLAALQRMAWGQWTIDEITTGEPFVRLRELKAAA